jgi:tol-pal system protein YbgF
MMSKSFYVRLFLCLIVLATPLSVSAQSKEQKEKIDRMAAQLEELKTELILVQRQTQAMQDTFNKTMGELNTLIVQMGDNISAVRRAQSAISTNTTDTSGQISSMGERITATNNRMERLSEQFASLRKLIEDIPKMPTFTQLTPGNAEQLFAAAYSDYSRGNFDLALSEFRQYVETFPSSELADNAQYWIAEILLAQRKTNEALAELEKVAQINPQGDKTSLALFKRATLLLELGRKDEAVAQFLVLLKDYAKTNEATLATQQLQQIAPEALAPPPAPEKTPPARRPKKP